MRVKINYIEIMQLSNKDQVRFALFCVMQTKSLTINGMNCCHIVEAWLNGDATVEDCHHVAAGLQFTNCGGSYSADCNAAFMAVGIPFVFPSQATSIALKAVEINPDAKDIIETYLYELLHLDEIVEKELLGE